MITFFAVKLYGAASWFSYGEFFSVFFRFISYASPVTVTKKTILLHLPFVGLSERRVTDLSALLFILFMLSSTAFDGFRETTIWYDTYWQYLRWANYQVFEVLGLLLSPFLFLILYLGVILIMKKLIPSKFSWKELTYAFAFSLLPIALVYSVAHYFTLFIIQGQEMIRLISDPFGWNWNLFGTAGFFGNAGILSEWSLAYTGHTYPLGAYCICHCCRLYHIAEAIH